MAKEDKWFCYIERAESHGRGSEVVYAGKPISLNDAVRVIGEHNPMSDGPTTYNINNISARQGRITINQQRAMRYGGEDVRTNDLNVVVHLGMDLEVFAGLTGIVHHAALMRTAEEIDASRTKQP